MVIFRDAEFSENGKFRFLLKRVWNVQGLRIMFIGLNPSIAGAEFDDPTITRLIHFAKKHGYGSFVICNLFPIIATKRARLIKHKTFGRAMGTTNMEYILGNAQKCNGVVFMWGATKGTDHRAKLLIERYPNALCFGHNKDGSPKHPLYLSNETKLIRYAQGTKSIRKGS